MKKIISRIVVFALTIMVVFPLFLQKETKTKAADNTIILRVCNWEEYIDEGGWDEDELIELESGNIFGAEALVNEFETWFEENYGKKVKVEYSCFGTNEELYSQLTLGDAFDLVCPSDYMIMKLMAENSLEPLSDEFFDLDKDDNYYIKGVSPYIQDTFERNEINNEKWSKYAAGYMWGVTGFVYNPDEVTKEEASTWSLLLNKDFYRQVTIKDNVRDAMFPAIGIIKSDLLMSEEFISDEKYSEKLKLEMNDTSDEMIEQTEALLKRIRNNVYSFETDSGKADMVSGKIVANLQWSGDGVYTIDQAEEDEVYLNWAVPQECTDLWFDGWVMLKSGIAGDADKKMAAEAFINFLSRPDNAVRNMYYIGYSSVIAGGDDTTVFEYIDYTYGAEEDEEEAVEYPIGYFFTGNNEDEDYILITAKEQLDRQLSAQYPSLEVISRSAVMDYFDMQTNAKVNQMWINIRCFNLSQITGRQWAIAGIIIVVIVTSIFGVVFAMKHTK